MPGSAVSLKDILLATHAVRMRDWSNNRAARNVRGRDLDPGPMQHYHSDKKYPHTIGLSIRPDKSETAPERRHARAAIPLEFCGRRESVDFSGGQQRSAAIASLLRVRQDVVDLQEY